MAFLHAHGITAVPDGLGEMVTEAVARMHRTLYPADPRADLPVGEVAALERAGFDLDARPGGRSDALDSTAAEFAALLATAVPTKGAAAHLGVATSRVRQRLTSDPPSLYGIRHRGGWRLPAFQFAPDGLVPGVDDVIRRLDPELHPVAVHRWFTTPSVDLVTDAGDRLSPRDWLRAGYPVAAVAELAARI